MASLQSHLFRQYIKFMAGRTDRSQAIEEQRQAMEDVAKFVSPHKKVTIEATEICGLYVEWLIPDNEAGAGVIIYLHGGGYAIGSVNTHRAMVTQIAHATRTRVCIVDYRLAPEHPFPAALHDAINVYGALLDSGYTADDITLMGESAGGGLVLSALICMRDSMMPLPRAAVVMSPFTDLTASGETVVTRLQQDPMNKPEDIVITDHYVGDNERTHPLISPLFADLHGLPPLYIQVGDDEIMLSDSTRFAEKAKAAGVDVTLDIWDNMWHVWQFFAPHLPEANRAIQAIGDYVKTH